MRRILIIVAVASIALALAGVASASIRHDVQSLVAKVAGTSSTAAKPQGNAPVERWDAQAVDSSPAGHGAAVSVVARDKDAVATKVLPNGKKVTNHGQAVSAAAHSRRDRPGKARANGRD